MGDLSAHFDTSEFACGCGCGFGLGPTDVDPDLIHLLEDMRLDYGGPIKINSGCRCKSHNDAVGGVKKSAHLRGTAADIAVDGGEDKHNLLSAAFGNDAYGVGVAGTFVHVDVDVFVKRPSAWGY